MAEDFDVIEELKTLSEQSRKEVLQIFTDIQSIDIASNSTILLTQHFANLRIMSFESQARIYQLMIDYFFSEKNIVIKPHPDDLMYYSLLFPEFQIIRERFPSEFLPFIFTNKPKCIATISSTGVFNLQNSFDEIFFLGFPFQEHFDIIHRYYAAIRFTKELGKKLSNITLIGADEELVKSLSRKISIANMEQMDGEIYIVDDISTVDEMSRDRIIKLAEELPENDAMIFLNTKQDFCFHDPDRKGIWNYIVPLCISKKCIRETEFFSDTLSETIYFFSKNERLIHLAGKFEFSNELKYSGLKVSLETLTSQEKQIKVLEGVLAATEERLLYYMTLAESKK